MGEARLERWSNVIDRRPLLKEDTFQSSMYEYAVNSNRGLYTKTGHPVDYRQKQDECWDKAVRDMKKAVRQ